MSETPTLPLAHYNLFNIFEPLTIQAQLYDTNIHITIDTGANINCIKHTLIPKNKIINKIQTQISGPTKEPLILLGITHLDITINNQKFTIQLILYKIYLVL